LSPEDGKWVTEDDQAFFDACLQLTQQGTPIFLGVVRRMAGEPSDWLGAWKYKAMASALVIRADDTTRLPLWVKMKDVPEPLPSLSLALARAHKKTTPPTWLVWALETNTERHPSEEFSMADALVNYSKLEALQQQALFTVDATAVKAFGVRFRNRMVILGDGTVGCALDSFIVQGRKLPIPGLYLHACAAYTFAREPLYELKPHVRLALDFLLPLLVIMVIALKRHSHRDNTKTFYWERFQRFAYIYVAAGTIVLGIVLVKYAAVLWLDLLLVALFLMAHPNAARGVEWVQGRRLAHRMDEPKHRRPNGE